MSVASEFNALNGMIVTRKDLEKLLEKADKERHTVISKRVVKVLEAFADDTFLIELKNLVEPYGLNGVEADMFLPTLEYISEDDTNGLNKAVSADDIYSYITEMIINTIDKVGHLPWQKEWKGSGAGGSAKNYASGKEYTGANYILNFDIAFDQEGQPYLVPIQFEQPYYLTFNQIKDAKAILNKGAKARRVIYYTFIFNYDNHNGLNIKTTDRTKWNEFVKANNIDKKELGENGFGVPVLKYYNVFRADDCTGLKFKEETTEAKKVTPIESAQAIIDAYRNPPTYTFKGDRAFYQPSGDILNMPGIETFSSEEFYYSTYFHEAIHSTGAQKRLNRDFSGRKGDKAYAFEELIAELGAVFLSGESGILFHTKENSAKYLQSWNRKLVDELTNDNRFFLKASAQAQKGANHILGRETAKEETPVTPEKVIQKVIAKPIITKPKTVKSSKKKKSEQLDLFDGLTGKASIKKGLNAPKPVVKTKSVKKEIVKTGQSKKGLNVQSVVAKIIAKEKTEVTVKVAHNENLDKNSLAYKMANKPKQVNCFEIEDRDISEFLGQIERKNKESVVVSLTGGQGSMKTRMCFQFMNALAQKYKIGHASIEEHPESNVYYDKAEQYLNDKALRNIEAPEIKNISELESLIKKNDVIVIDSFTKMQEMEKGFEVDKDLRKKYDGKLFFVIFQQTTDGKMRGGSKSQFDADIVLFTEKKDDYRDNYIYADKNRYQNKPLDGLKFNIFNKKLEGYTPEATAEPATKRKLSFTVN
jgi:antirestriction protein ArdC/nucleoside-triphosphatase THEP1